MENKPEKTERDIPPKVLEQLKRKLGYKEETILTLAKGLDQIDRQTFLQLTQNDPVFREALLLKYLSRNEEAAVSYFAQFNIDFKEIMALPKEEASKRIEEA